MHNELRNEKNKKSPDLESILKTLNDTFHDDELSLIEKFNSPEYPVFLIVGNARSGSTVLYQWLANTGLFAYPSNLISRFYNAPYIGALIHKAFIDHDKFGEILGNAEIEFKSRLGKTSGARSPNEFWYFWRRFFKFGEIQSLTEQELKEVESGLLLKELAALEQAFDKPLVLKAMILNWNLDYLMDVIPQPVFLHIKRDPIDNMESLYNARVQFFGNTDAWYSFKPPEYEFLKEKDVYAQLAGQVYYTDLAVEKSFGKYEDKHKLVINYEDFCKAPSKYYDALSELLKLHGIPPLPEYTGPDQFTRPAANAPGGFDRDKARQSYEIYLT